MAINLYIFGTEILRRSSRKVHKPKWERLAHAWCDVRRFINFDPESNIAKCYQILRPLIVCSVNTVSCFFIWYYVINCCLTEQRHTKRLNHLNVLGENQEIYLQDNFFSLSVYHAVYFRKSLYKVAKIQKIIKI